jgi:hypothetical protein
VAARRRQTCEVSERVRVVRRGVARAVVESARGVGVGHVLRAEGRVRQQHLVVRTMARYPSATARAAAPGAQRRGWGTHVGRKGVLVSGECEACLGARGVA